MPRVLQFPGSQNSLMRQAMAMRKKVAAAQDKVGTESFTGTSGQVSVTVSGRHEILDVKIGRIEPDEAGMLEGMVASAVNEALARAREAMDNALAVVNRDSGLPAGL